MNYAMMFYTRTDLVLNFVKNFAKKALAFCEESCIIGGIFRSYTETKYVISK